MSGSFPCPLCDDDHREPSKVALSKHIFVKHGGWRRNRDVLGAHGLHGCIKCDKIFHSQATAKPDCHQNCFHIAAAPIPDPAPAPAIPLLDPPPRSAIPEIWPLYRKDEYIAACRQAIKDFCDAVDQNAPLEEQIAKSRRFLELGAYAHVHNRFVHPVQLLKKAGGRNTAEFSVWRAVWLAAVEGDVGKAAAALVGRPRVLSADEPWVEQLLQTLYPRAYGDGGDRKRPEGPQPKICPGADNVAFRAELWKLAQKKRWKGPGLSGWTFARMIYVWDCQSDPACVNFFQVARLVELLVTGKLDRDGLRDDYVNQRGVALSKEGTSAEKARPLGITETFTRLASAWLVRDNREALAEVMDEDNFGFGVSAGSEKLAYTIRALLRANPSWVWLHTDFKNAFNSLSRDQVLAFARKFPKFAPFIWMVYAQSSKVAYSKTVFIVNEEGVIQGLPDAAVVFEVILQLAAKGVRQRHSLVRLLGQFDDYHILGEPAAVMTAFLDFAATFKREFHLEMQFDKCELYSERPMDEWWATEFENLGVKLVSPDHCAPEEHGMLAAGTPIGTEAYVQVQLSLRFRSAELLLGRLRQAVDVRMPKNISSKQGLFYTAKLCGHALVTFTLRTVCCSLTIPWARRLTDAHQNFFLCLINRLDLVKPGGWASADERDLFRLRLFLANRHGGMGLIDSEKAAPSALLGCLRQSAEFLQKRTGLFGSNDAIARYLPELSKGIAAYEVLGGTLPADYVADSSFFGLAPRAPPNVSPPEHYRGPQTELMEGLYSVDLRQIETRFLPATPPSDARRAWKSLAGAHAGAAFVRSPAGYGLSMRNEAFDTMGSLRTGLVPPLILQNVPRDGFFRCPHYKSCGGTITRFDSTHWFTCKGVPKTQQHNLIQAAVRACATEIRPTVGLAISRKPPPVAQHFARNPASASQPNSLADMLVEAVGHNKKVIDFVTVHPRHRPHTLSSTKNGAAAEHAAKGKFDKYQKNFILSQPGVDFVAFAVETYGTSGQQAQEFLEWMGHLAYPLQEVGGRIVDVDGLYGAFISRAYARIAVAVAMGNCQRLEQWLSPLQTEAVLRVAEAPMDEGGEEEEEDVDEVADEVVAEEDEVVAEEIGMI